MELRNVAVGDGNLRLIALFTLITVMLCLTSLGCGGKASSDVVVDNPMRSVLTYDATVSSDVILTGDDARVFAGPLGEPQGLDDFANGIEPWGPVVTVHTVTLPNDEVHVVSQLASPDPFTAMYQLEDGTLVTTNDPLPHLVLGLECEEPQEIVWLDADAQSWNVYYDEIIVLFKPTATESEIWTIISEYNLDVRMSWFEAADINDLGEGALTNGNDIAWFQFGIDSQIWTNLDIALAYFNSNPLVDVATPSFTDVFQGEYAYPHWTTPVNDYFYNIPTPDPLDEFPWDETFNMYITAYGIDNNPFIRLASDYGYNTNSVVAVIDTGAWRNHLDLQGALAPVGIDCRGNRIIYGTGLGNPDSLIYKGASHGTSVIGQINAVTNNSEGVASIAPRAKVLPIRLDVKRYEYAGTIPLFGYTSMVKAIRALFFYHRKWQVQPAWDFDIPIVNISIGSTGTPQITQEWKALHANITRDVCVYDRLYTAAAGNEAQMKKVYPAAYPETLGVTGLWYDKNSVNHWCATNNNGEGSNYWSSNVYQISGIYGYLNCIGKVPISYLEGNQYYGNAEGTSFAAPQIAAFAFDILDIYPNYTRTQIVSSIISARDDSTSCANIAGIPDFMDPF